MMPMQPDLLEEEISVICIWNTLKPLPDEGQTAKGVVITLLLVCSAMAV